MFHRLTVRRAAALPARSAVKVERGIHHAADTPDAPAKTEWPGEELERHREPETLGYIHTPPRLRLSHRLIKGGQNAGMVLQLSAG